MQGSMLSGGVTPQEKKVPATPGETREEGNLLVRGCLLLGNHGAGSVAPGDPTGARNGIFPQLHLILHAVEPFPGQGIYSLPQIYLSWMELEVL